MADEGPSLNQTFLKPRIPTGPQGSLNHPLGAGIQKPSYLSPPMTIEPPKAQTSRFLYNTATPQFWFPSSSFKFDEMWKPNAELTSVIKNVYKAVRRGIYPERIGAGSSGSYLVKNTEGKIIAVYKPSDEEPYSEYNPKLIKMLHRTCSPCLFGRSCLMPNVGFISEVAASVVDRHFGLGIVPRTEIVELTSPTFNYGYWFWKPTTIEGLKPKKGSFQLFISGLYKSEDALEKLNIVKDRFPHITFELQLEFEKLVVLDYLVRNTDRSWDNWLFCIEWRDPKTNELRSNQLIPPIDIDVVPSIKIVGIDNGLAFPWKHPDEWRLYPYSWIGLDLAKIPFSESIKSSLLPILRDYENWDRLVNRDLLDLFKHDPLFTLSIFRRQMSVLRGQMRNLLIALELGYSPYDLVHKLPPVRIEVEDDWFMHRYGKRTDRGGFEPDPDTLFTDSQVQMYKKLVQRRPFCRLC